MPTVPYFMCFTGEGGPPAAASQAAVTPTTGAAVAATAATNTTPFGYTTNTQANALVTNVNTLRVDVLAAIALLNEIRAALVAAGMMKGSA